MSRCRPALCNSEDDTIMEESTFSHHQKENVNHQQHQSQRVATILRSRSCRDREVLSKSRYCIFFFSHYFFAPKKITLAEFRLYSCSFQDSVI